MLLNLTLTRAVSFVPSGVDIAARTVAGVVTTQKVDSHRSIILTDGLDWERYLKNPVFCAQHDRYTLPIGQAVEVNPGDGMVVCKFQLSESEDGEEYLQAYARGEIRGFSIAGRILDCVTKWDGDEAIKSLPEFCKRAFLDGGCDYVIRKMKIMEVSAATVPSNEDTLVFRDAHSSDLLLSMQLLDRRIAMLERAKSSMAPEPDCKPEPPEDADEEDGEKAARTIAQIAHAALPLLRYR